MSNQMSGEHSRTGGHAYQEVGNAGPIIERLTLTLERPPSKGPVETAIVTYPKTYEEAVDVAYEVYKLGARSIKKEDITLRCLTYRHIGYEYQAHWACVIPREWETVVHHRVEQVGVFLEADKHEWNRVPVTSLGKRILGPAKSILGLLAVGYALRR